MDDYCDLGLFDLLELCLDQTKYFGIGGGFFDELYPFDGIFGDCAFTRYLVNGGKAALAMG